MATTKENGNKKPEMRVRSWFVVCPNVRTNGVAGIPPEVIGGWSEQEICDYIVNEWTGSKSKQAACLYCISASGMEHLHMVLCGVNSIKFSTVKNFVGDKGHIEMTKGNRKQVDDYINKRGVFEEKGEKILAKAQIGEVVGRQGARTDYEIIRAGIEDGLTWKEVRRLDDKFFKPEYTTMIRAMYFDKREQETPFKRVVNVHWYFGDSGSGKTGKTFDLVEELGEDRICLVSEYTHPFDDYAGEPILVLDEFRGQLKYSELLGLLEGYKKRFAARYSNITGLWTDVYITTIATPEQVYKKMMEKADEKEDPISQLIRRISDITYCYKVLRPTGTKRDEDGRPCEFYKFTVTKSLYKALGGNKSEQVKELAKKDYLINHFQTGDDCSAFGINPYES